LRLAHEDNEALDIAATIHEFSEGLAIVQATVKTDKGVYTGYGTATIQRDSRLKLSLLELAETRAIARALRFAGYGVEYTGLEEVDYETNEHAKTGEQAKEKVLLCDRCRKQITEAEKNYSESKYNKALCRECQKQV
jgi:hypothetical protein